jgi:hypothetical protein
VAEWAAITTVALAEPLVLVREVAVVPEGYRGIMGQTEGEAVLEAMPALVD